MKRSLLFSAFAICSLAAACPGETPGTDGGDGRDTGAPADAAIDAGVADRGVASDLAPATDHATGADHPVSVDGGATPNDIWITAYLASWNLYVEPGGNWGNLPIDAIDWSAFSHLIFFALGVEASGALCCTGQYENFNEARIRAIVAAAHAHNKPILFSVGGAGNHDDFAAAIQSATRSALVDNLVSTLTTWGFDGIDLDLEPIYSGDEANFQALVNALDARLATLATPLLARPLLTAAVGPASAFAPVHAKFDQINLMTYDLSGAWEGWVSWHNAPIYNGGFTFPSTGGPLPCADAMVDEFISAGIPAAKLGIGIDFYGYVWSGGSGTSTGGVTRPRQEWSTAPTVTGNVAYHQVMSDYYSSGVFHWDDVAKAAYVAIDDAQNQNDRFVSFDDQNTAAAKVTYARDKGIGGLIIWEIASGYRADQAPGQRDQLLQSLKQAWYSGQ